MTTSIPTLSGEENEALAELRRRLDALLAGRLERMVLFGSKARGDSERDSDIDVAILVHGLTGELKRRILDIVAEIELDRLLPLSTLVLSTDEFARLKSRELRLALDIEHEGIAP
jgi:predicted nucleotidyltransferase